MITPTPARHTAAPTMSQRSGHEHAAVGSQHPTELRIGLKGGDKAVGAQRDHPEAGPGPSTMLADALPDQPGTTDLEHRSHRKQQDRFGDSHRISVGP
jgi:hypothetical protein